jgi:hypothetical protein
VTCPSGPHEPYDEASSADLSPAQLPSSVPPLSSPVVSTAGRTGVRTAATTDRTAAAVEARTTAGRQQLPNG